MRCALTTVDNPFNPLTEFHDWFLFDIEKGYYTSEYLARIARTSDSFTDEENDQEIERAIDEIIRLDPLNLYKKFKEGSEVTVTKPVFVVN